MRLRNLFNSMFSTGVEMANENPVSELDCISSAFAANEYKEDGWIQLSPFGKFPNVQGMQVFNPQDSKTICDEFANVLNLGVRVMGIPFYIGHPDHPLYEEKYKDGRSYGRIKNLETRHDAGCNDCRNFVNEESDEPCTKHGLFGKTKWNSMGKELIANEAFHGHSVNWRLKRVGQEFHPVSLKSVGFTNQPNIPVQAITAANEVDTKTVDNRFTTMANIRVLAPVEENIFANACSAHRAKSMANFRKQ